MPISLRTLCLVTAVLCNVHGSLEHEIPRRSFLSRRAIDGTRGRKFFDPEEEGAFDSYGSAGGKYDPYEEKTDLSDIRRNVPGEPGIDYPAHTRLPQTGFTCEGRSRGYYADEVSGCQVFHVCHDVLVSSFLCPIGSIFSQKLLTCDWWAKVDCSATQKYIDVNRNSYQQDDDEMIRNAYAMVSLQSGTDVTKDGLVDPDRTGSLVDYNHGIDYSTVDTTGNDLRHGFEDYTISSTQRTISNYDRYKERKPDTGRNYQEKFFTRDRTRSPYQDSPIIRIQKIDDRRSYDGQNRNRDFEDTYRRPNEFTNQFQPSYAPTVPTVTTTTRRFYSPTVPTTLRPSTIAYNKLDQFVDSSDYFFSHSRTKSFVTPPTRIFPHEDRRHESFEEDSRRSGIDFPKKTDEEEYSQEERYEDDYDDFKSEEERNERPQVGFEARLINSFRLNRTTLGNDDGHLSDRVYREYERGKGESIEDIETRGSIGLGHALRQPFRRISIHEQNPVDGKAKNEYPSSATLNRSGHSSVTNYAKLNVDYPDTLTKPDEASNEETATERDAEGFERNHNVRINRPSERVSIKEANSNPDTHASHPISPKSTVEVTTRVSAISNRSSEYVSLTENNSPANYSTELNTKTRPISKEDSIDRMDNNRRIHQPAEFLKPPDVPYKFRINVPDPVPSLPTLLGQYSTIDDKPYPETKTTKVPTFGSSYSGESVKDPIVYDRNVDTTLSRNDERDRLPASLAADVPVADVVPPESDYNGSFDGSVIPHEDAASNVPPSQGSKDPSGLNYSLLSKNKSEEEALGSYNSGFQFTIRDAISGRFSSEAPCSTNLDGNVEPCRKPLNDEVSTSTSSPLIQTTVDRAVHSDSPPDPYSSLSVLNTFENIVTSRSNVATLTTTIAPLNIATQNINEDSPGSTERIVIWKDTNSKEIETKHDKREEINASTANILFHSIQPETIKQIEETIEHNNAPYQVSLTINNDEDLAHTGDDLIRRLLAHQGTENTTLNDKVREFEVVKSVEPEIQAAINTQPSIPGPSETKDQPLLKATSDEASNTEVFQSNRFTEGNLTSSVDTLSLLQLMAELLKLDRIPRPFAPTDSQPSEFNTRSTTVLYDTPTTTDQSLLDRLQARTVARDINLNIQLDDKGTTPFTSSTESVEETSRPLLKEQILGQLTQNFGQPLYREDRTIFDLPEVQRSLDFQTGLPIQVPRISDGFNNPRAILSTTFKTSTEPTDGTTIVTTTPKVPITTEKTIVKTEFVPSIGFSFDTNEGREEYAQAILGGLIDDNTKENGRKKANTTATIGIFSKNETSRGT